MNLDEKKAFILYKKILSEVNEERTLKDISERALRDNGKAFSVDWVSRVLIAMENIKLVKKVYDSPKCVRYRRTNRGDKLLEIESIEKLER